MVLGRVVGKIRRYFRFLIWLRKPATSLVPHWDRSLRDLWFELRLGESERGRWRIRVQKLLSFESPESLKSEMGTLWPKVGLPSASLPQLSCPGWPRVRNFEPPESLKSEIGTLWPKVGLPSAPLPLPSACHQRAYLLGEENPAARGASRTGEGGALLVRRGGEGVRAWGF